VRFRVHDGEESADFVQHPTINVFQPVHIPVRVESPTHKHTNIACTQDGSTREVGCWNSFFRREVRTNVPRGPRRPEASCEQPDLRGVTAAWDQHLLPDIAGHRVKHGEAPPHSHASEHLTRALPTKLPRHNPHHKSKSMSKISAEGVGMKRLTATVRIAHASSS
jgi:hypothetical protein